MKCDKCGTEINEVGWEARSVAGATIYDGVPHTSARCLEVVCKQRDEAQKGLTDVVHSESARMGHILDIVEAPGSHPVGAPNSTMRRAQDIGKRFAIARAQLDAVSGALCDAADVTVYEGDYARSVRELTAQRDEARENVDKYYVKARVYGAISYEWRKALQAFADRGEALAQAALDWRNSERNGVPMKAVEEMDALLNLERDLADARAKLSECEREREKLDSKRAYWMRLAETNGGLLARAESALAAERARGERLREELRDVQGQLLNHRDGLEGRLTVANVLAGIVRALHEHDTPDAAEKGAR